MLISCFSVRRESYCYLIDKDKTMPELPEVETTCRGIAPIKNACIMKVDIMRPSLRYPFDIPAMKRLEGQSVKSIGRRGKIIIIELSQNYLLIHLGMTGHLVLYDSELPIRKHDHVLFSLSNGYVMRYHDVRRFGYMEIVDDPQESSALSRMGVEPLADDFNANYLIEKARGRSVALKALIMDQAVVVGVGNIYASEALFNAGILPTRKSSTLTIAEASCLVSEIKVVLQQAIVAGGTTLKDFISPSKKLGYFVQELKVYGRENLPCAVCDTLLSKSVITGRSSVYCVKCQK